MQRSISTKSLLFTSVSAILGSGWLFSAYYTAQLAGPASIYSWLLGGLFIVIVAFVFAELCAMMPVSGSSARIPQFTHGSMVSFVFAWLIWLSYLSLMSTEVQAVIQYSSYYFPSLTYSSGQLTSKGYIAATILMVFVSTINTYSLRWLIKANDFLTIIKIIIPLILVGIVMYYFSSEKSIFHPAHSEFAPMGFHGVLGAISMGGIMFAFNGFKQAAEMAGEAKNPKFSVPFAIVGSVVLCLAIYLLLQIAFLSSLTPENILNGWPDIQLKNNNSPFSAIVVQDNLASLLPLLYIGAIIGPFAAGLMYCGSAARSIYGMSTNGYIPKVFQKLSGYGNPVYAIIVNFFFGMMLFAPLPGWDKMVNFLSSLLAVTYSIGPICLITLRKQMPNYKRPVKLPFGKTWSFLAFYICTLLAYWSGWDTLSKMGIAIGSGLIILFLCEIFSYESKGKLFDLDFKSSLWMWPYLIGLMALSYIGNYGGGLGLFDAKTMLALFAIFCLVIIKLSTVFKLSSEKTANYLQELEFRHDIDEHHNDAELS